MVLCEKLFALALFQVLVLIFSKNRIMARVFFSDFWISNKLHSRSTNLLG